MTPQLYEWLSTGFPLPVNVYYYSISTTHPPHSVSSLSSSETLLRISPSSLRSEESDSVSDRSLFVRFDELESYVSSSESLAQDARSLWRSLSLGSEEHGAETDVARDPWTTWFPPTPPLRPRSAPVSTSFPSPVLWDAGVTISALLHSLRARSSGLDVIDEGHVDFAQGEADRVAPVSGLCEGLPDDEDGLARCVHDERDSPPGSRLCWACRAILQRYARRHGLFP